MSALTHGTVGCGQFLVAGITEHNDHKSTVVFDTYCNTTQDIYAICHTLFEWFMCTFYISTFFNVNVNGNVHVSCLCERRVVSKIKPAMVGSGATFRRTTQEYPCTPSGGVPCMVRCSQQPLLRLNTSTLEKYQRFLALSCTCGIPYWYPPHK